MVRAFALIVSAGLSASAASAQSGGGDGPIPPPGDIPGCEVGVSFDNPDFYLPELPTDVFNLDLFGTNGNQAISFTGPQWAQGGIVDNSAAISSPFYNGPTGGPDPTGERGGMLHMQRASVQAEMIDVPFIDEFYDITHANVAATEGRAIFLTVDVYKNSHADLQQFSWISAAEGLFAAVATAGGFEPGTFFAGLRGAPDLIEGVVVAAPVSGLSMDLNLGSKDVPEGGWYTLGVLISPTSITYWLRDRETATELDVRTPIRTSGAHSGERMFAEYGLGLEEDWAQLYPGTLDDPATPDIVEGFGRARDIESRFVEGLIDSSGNRVGVLWGAASVDRLRVFAGNDPAPAELPSYEIRDWWIDNYCVRFSDSLLVCEGDLDGDGVVGPGDLAALISGWGGGGAGDLDGSGVVDAADLAALISAWGSCP